MQNSEIVIFDLDGTLTESKSPLEKETADLIVKLLEKQKIAIITGGAFEQIEKQFLRCLVNVNLDLLQRLYLCPTSGAALYEYDTLTNKWRCVYSEEMTHTERDRIKIAIGAARRDIGLKLPEKLYGAQIEDRKSQVTFSALGQKAPLELKRAWDADGSKRRQLKAAMERYIPSFEIRLGGSTSIDVTRRGIDKGFGVSKLLTHLNIAKEKVVFVGDALYENGNDYPVKKLGGIFCIAVKNVEETRAWINYLLG